MLLALQYSRQTRQNTVATLLATPPRFAPMSDAAAQRGTAPASALPAPQLGPGDAPPHETRTGPPPECAPLAGATSSPAPHHVEPAAAQSQSAVSAYDAMLREKERAILE